MKKILHNDQKMALEYRFDYSKAKPNRFAEKMKVGWMVERFVGASARGNGQKSKKN
jgi:hypothetical protein